MIFLLVDVQTVIPVDRVDQGGLDIADTLLGEETFLWVGGENDHVDMEVLLFFVECGIPTQMIRMNLIALGDVCDGGIDECLQFSRSVYPKRSAFSREREMIGVHTFP